MEFLNSSFGGPALLLVALLVLTICISVKTKRDHTVAMQKYEEGMAAYQASLENNSGELKFGVSFVPPDIIMTAQSDAVAPYFGPAGPLFGGADAMAMRMVGGDYQVELAGVDERTAAMVIAILCEELGGDLSTLHFRSIKAI